MSRPAPARDPSPAGSDARPTLRPVPERRPRHTLRYALTAILVTGAAVFGAVSLNALAAGDAVRSERLQAEVVEAERLHGQLVTELGRLQDPDRIRRVARRMGMQVAPSRRYLETRRSLPDDGRPGEAVRAGEATDPLKPVLSVQR